MAARNSSGQNISAGSTISGIITFTVTANDPVVAGQITSGLASVVLKLDGIAVANTGSGGLTYNLNTQNLLSTPHTVQAVATDSAGNSVSSQTFTLGVIGFLAGWQ